MVAFFGALDRIPVDRITSHARQVHFWRTALTVIAGLLFGAGWLAAKGVGLGWLALAWTVTAVRVGWVDGRKPTHAAR